MDLEEVLFEADFPDPLELALLKLLKLNILGVLFLFSSVVFVAWDVSLVIPISRTLNDSSSSSSSISGITSSLPVVSVCLLPSSNSDGTLSGANELSIILKHSLSAACL